VSSLPDDATIQALAQIASRIDTVAEEVRAVKEAVGSGAATVANAFQSRSTGPLS
jgi:hypothetical protein